MTNATIHDFARDLKALNPEQADKIFVYNFENLIYNGEKPERLVVPQPFAWDEKNGGFSDLAALEAAGMELVFQVFFVNRVQK